MTTQPQGSEFMARPVSSSSGVRVPRRAGPYPRLRLDLTVKVDEGLAVFELVVGRGFSFRQAAAELGMSVTTAWRRCRWLQDWLLPDQYGVRVRRLPTMRGSRACPRGRPWIEELDGPGGPLYWKGSDDG